MASRQPRYDHYNTTDTRLSRLETIIDSISSTLEKIQNKLDTESKINWAPVGLGLTIFMAIVGSFATIYTTHMDTTDTNLKTLAESTQQLAVASTEQRIAVQTLKDRQDDFKTQTEKHFDDIEKRMDKNSDRIRTLEGLPKTVKDETDYN